MIDGKKLKWVAEEYAGRYFGLPKSLEAGIWLFMKGFNYFLSNLWYDARKYYPQDGKNILIEYRNNCDKSICYKTMNPYHHGNFNDENVKKHGAITRWLYIDDLLKGGK